MSRKFRDIFALEGFVEQRVVLENELLITVGGKLGGDLQPSAFRRYVIFFGTLYHELPVSGYPWRDKPVVRDQESNQPVESSRLSKFCDSGSGRFDVFDAASPRLARLSCWLGVRRS